MNQDGIWYGGRLRVAALHETGTAAPPHLFGPCLLWPQSPILATADLLLTYNLPKGATAHTDKVFTLVVKSHLTSWRDQNLSIGALLLSLSLLLSSVMIIIMHFLRCHVSVG